MNKLLKIATVGEEVLLRRAKPVEKVKDTGIQKLIDEMTETLKYDNGVGLAAPQVFESKRIIIVHSYPNPRYPDAPEFGPKAMVNPVIAKRSEEKEKGWEGCLSIPGYRGLVPRYKRITVRYVNRDGKSKQIEVQDFIARIVQHEVDHLEGRLCLLYWLEDIENLMTEKNWQKMMAKKK